MSRVSDIIVLSSLSEIYPDSGEELEFPRAIAGINAWLEEHEWAPLVRVDRHIGMNSEKAFQACAHGGALNHLDVKQFLTVLASQEWEDRDAVRLLMKHEEEDAFTCYVLQRGGFKPLPLPRSRSRRTHR